METTVEETQHLAAGPIFKNSNCECGPASGSRLDDVDATLNQASTPFVDGDGVTKTASAPPLNSPPLGSNTQVTTLPLGEIDACESRPSKIAGDIVDQSVDPLTTNHIESTQSTLASGTVPGFTDPVIIKDEKATCETSIHCSLSQSTPGPTIHETLSDDIFPVFEDSSTPIPAGHPILPAVEDSSTPTVSGLPTTETQTVTPDLAKPPTSEAPTIHHVDTPEAHSSGTSDSGDESSFVNMTTDSMSSSSASLCSEETSFVSSPLDSPVSSKGGEQIASTAIAQTDILVKVPDMLSSIMSAKVIVNPHYFSAKPKIDSWTKRILGKSQEWSVKNSMVDVTYLAAAWAPTADEDGLILLADWGNWVFIFDDVFDEGVLKDDVPAAQKKLDQMMALMNNTLRIEQADDPLGYIFQSVWDRFMKNSTPDQQQHWRDMHQRYFSGLLQQVQRTHAGQACPTTVAEYLTMRLGTIGADPAIAVIEYVTGVDLPPAVFSHPCVQKLMTISAELVILHNDVISFKKDMDLNVSINLITLLGTQSSSPSPIQAALDDISGMLDACYRRWYMALAEMPTWGEKLDREVLRFAAVCRDLALGNLHWSFRSPRYLGIAQGLEVQATRELWLPRLE